MIYRLDRLSRSVVGAVRFFQGFRENAVQLAVVTAPEPGHTAQDSFMLNILASFAEFNLPVRRAG